MTAFDETKREQTYYKQIIKDSFSWVFKRNSKMSKAFTLENQHPEMGMRVTLLDLDKKEKPEIALDRNEMYVILSGNVYIKPVFNP